MLILSSLFFVLSKMFSKDRAFTLFSGTMFCNSLAELNSKKKKSILSNYRAACLLKFCSFVLPYLFFIIIRYVRYVYRMFAKSQMIMREEKLFLENNIVLFFFFDACVEFEKTQILSTKITVQIGSRTMPHNSHLSSA